MSTQRVGIGVVGMVVVALIAAGTTDVVRFLPFTVPEFVQLVTPLFLAALFIERAVEVFITGWRDLETTRLKDARRASTQAAASAKGAAATTAKETLTVAQRALADYQAETRRWAFAGGVFLGVIVAGLGVRGFGLFIDPEAFAGLGQGQRFAFQAMDTLLTAGLLAGGSEALHQFVTTFTSFLATTRRNITGDGA